MKKTIKILLVLFYTNVIIGQINQEKINGHWGYCDKEYGYTELMISDTLYYRISEKFGLRHTTTFNKIEKDFIIPKWSINKTDTLFFNRINNKQLTMKWNRSEKDTMNLINEISPFENMSNICEQKMSRSQYVNHIRSEYEIRKIKNIHKCTPQILYNMKEGYDAETIPYAASFSLTDDELSITKAVYLESFNYQILKENVDDFENPILIEIIENKKTNKSLIIIDYWGKCYSDFRISTTIKNNELIEISTQQEENNCNNKCKLRLYVNVGLLNYSIKGINLNNIKIK